MKKIIVLSVITLALLCVNSIAYDGDEEARIGQFIFLNDSKLKQSLANDPPSGSNLAALCMEAGNALGPRYGDPKVFAQKLGIEPHPDFLKYGYGVPLYNWHNYSRDLTPEQIRSVLLTLAIGAAKEDGDDSDARIFSKLLYLSSKLGEGDLTGNFLLEAQANLGVKSNLSMYLYRSLFDGNREMFEAVVAENSSSLIEDLKKDVSNLSF